MKSIAVALLCFMAVRLHAEPELKGTASDLTQYLQGLPKLVAVTGESELKIAADRALVSLKVVTENRSLHESLRTNQQIRAKMISLLKDRGIPPERVSALKFSSTPKYGVFGDKAKSYTVENVVKIIVQDEKEFQAVAGLVDGLSEVRYDGIEFQHSDKEGLKIKALDQAIDKAGERKRLYEAKLGVKLSPKSFFESDVSVGLPLAMRRDYGKMTESANAGRYAVPLETPGAIDASELPNDFGELVYKARVTIEYSVESK